VINLANDFETESALACPTGSSIMNKKVLNFDRGEQKGSFEPSTTSKFLFDASTNECVDFPNFVAQASQHGDQTMEIQDSAFAPLAITPTEEPDAPMMPIMLRGFTPKSGNQIDRWVDCSRER